MCGRYTLRKFPDAVALADNKRLEIRDAPAPYQARYNIAPTQQNWILLANPQIDRLEAKRMRWGLIPSWSKNSDSRSPLINARHETAAEKPSFKAAWQRRRCLIPADGFYEWKRKKGASLPHFFRMKDDAVFFMAGIWEAWQSESGERINSYTILTTRPNALLAKYHDRMPAILQADAIGDWLGAPPKGESIFQPYDPAEMDCQPANPCVNNNTNEGPECLEEPPKQAHSQLDMGF